MTGSKQAAFLWTELAFVRLAGGTVLVETHAAPFLLCSQNGFPQQLQLLVLSPLHPSSSSAFAPGHRIAHKHLPPATFETVARALPCAFLVSEKPSWAGNMAQTAA